MKKIISSPMAKLLALLGGYAAALSVVRALDDRFDRYVGNVMWNWLKMGPAVSLPLFAVCAGLFCLSVRKSKSCGKPRVWRRVDFSLLAVYALCGVLSCAYLAWRNHHSSVRLMLSSAAIYLIAMVFLAETIARARDKQLVLYWLRFFKLYPVYRLPGLMITPMLVGNLFALFILCPIDAVGSQLNLPLFLFSIFTLTALTYFCAFVLSLSARYEEANAEKVRAERFKAELITNVSHDIRTPLTSIISYVGLLKSLPVDREDFSGYVDVLDRKAARLKTLINDLMEASKAATGNIAVNLGRVGLSEIVGQIAWEFDDQFADRGLTFVLRCSDGQAPVLADGNHLWRVLENLFGNAAKYALPGTRVFAEIGPCGGQTVFSLKNTSQNPIDLPADELTEQFIRGDRVRRTDGSGLGLYIAKNLAELMGCRFTIRATGDLFEAEIQFG